MIALRPEDLPVGQPLPWALFDETGNLLLGGGNVIPDTRDVALVFRHGAVFRAEDLPEAGNDGAPAPNANANVNTGPFGLQVGTLLQIKSPTDAGRAAASRLMGFFEHGLFVGWPQLGGKEIPFRAGEPVLLRGFSGETIYSFTCEITAVCRSPFRYLVLSSPTQVEQMPVRKSVRVSTRLAALLSDGAHAAQAERLAVLSDLSIGGAMVQIAGELPAPGANLKLRFQLRTAASDSEIVLDACARALPPTQGSARDDTEFVAFGVTFDMLPERESALLQCFVYEQMLSNASMRI